MAARNCVRCRKELTDAASMEAGIGPVCRQLDNALLAQHFTADVATARKLIEEIPFVAIDPVCMGALGEVRAAVKGPDGVEPVDFRKTVKQIEWILSYETAPGTLDKFAATVAALGYVGLAALWLGEAATGEASVWLQDGRKFEIYGEEKMNTGFFLFVSGPRNSAVNTKIKAIQGRRFHTKEILGRPRAGWSVPVEQLSKFKAAICGGYPNHTIEAGSWAELEKLAANASPTVKARAEAVKGTATIVDATDGIVIRAPFNAAFVEEIKRLPYQARQWVKELEAWYVAKSYEKQACDLVAKHFAVPAEESGMRGAA